MLWYIAVLFLTWMLSTNGTSPAAAYYGYGIAFFGFIGMMQTVWANFQKKQADLAFDGSEYEKHHLLGQLHELRRRIRVLEHNGALEHNETTVHTRHLFRFPEMEDE